MNTCSSHDEPIRIKCFTAYLRKQYRESKRFSVFKQHVFLNNWWDVDYCWSAA
jgi:hypothetical protein